MTQSANGAAEQTMPHLRPTRPLSREDTPPEGIAADSVAPPGPIEAIFAAEQRTKDLVGDLHRGIGSSERRDQATHGLLASLLERLARVEDRVDAGISDARSTALSVAKKHAELAVTLRTLADEVGKLGTEQQAIRKALEAQAFAHGQIAAELGRLNRQDSLHDIEFEKTGAIVLKHERLLSVKNAAKSGVIAFGAAVGTVLIQAVEAFIKAHGH